MNLKAHDPMERSRRYLRKCPPAISGQFGSKVTFRIVCVLVREHGLTEDQTLDVMQEWNRTCQPPWTEFDLRRKIQAALCTSAHPSYGRKNNPVRQAPICDCKSKFNPETLARVAAKMPGVEFDYVRARSPLCPETQTPATFLQRLFRPGEWVLVFDEFKSQGINLCQWSELPYDAACLNHLVHGCPNGVWFLGNPVDGKFHPNARSRGKMSRRSEESVTSWRYMVLESDEADELQWLAALVQMPLRIAAIYTSGGRSLHSLIRMDAASKGNWDEKVNQLKPLLIELGACRGSLTAVRLTRLPGCFRGEQGPPAPKQPFIRKRWVDEPLRYDEVGDPIWIPDEPVNQSASQWNGGKLQELLYLNPEPDLEPICQKRTRREIFAMNGSRKNEEELRNDICSHIPGEY